MDHSDGKFVSGTQREAAQAFLRAPFEYAPDRFITYREWLANDVEEGPGLARMLQAWKESWVSRIERRLNLLGSVVRRLPGNESKEAWQRQIEDLKQQFRDPENQETGCRDVFKALWELEKAIEPRAQDISLADPKERRGPVPKLFDALDLSIIAGSFSRMVEAYDKIHHVLRHDLLKALVYTAYGPQAKPAAEQGVPSWKERIGGYGEGASAPLGAQAREDPSVQLTQRLPKEQRLQPKRLENSKRALKRLMKEYQLHFRQLELPPKRPKVDRRQISPQQVEEIDAAFVQIQSMEAMLKDLEKLLHIERESHGYGR